MKKLKFMLLVFANHLQQIFSAGTLKKVFCRKY